MDLLAQHISVKKRYLAEQMGSPIEQIAIECSSIIDAPDQLDLLLKNSIDRLPRCNQLYVSNYYYKQVSSSVSRNNIIQDFRGNNLSGRPYLSTTVPMKGLVLSGAYQPPESTDYFITLLQAIQKDNQLKGLLLADFKLEDIPVSASKGQLFTNWWHYKGDPAIREALFSQKRVDSYIDIQIDKVHDSALKLMSQHGIFHIEIQYSSSRATLWPYDSPHYYRLYSTDELLNGTASDLYPIQGYPRNAKIHLDLVNKTFQRFKELRFIDENIYLRSGSINVINGMVGLNFSCDGSHYIQVDEFLSKSLDFWLGKLQSE